MPGSEVIPELKEIIGAMIFAANRPIGVKEMHQCLLDVARNYGAETAVFAETRPGDVKAALDELGADLERAHSGFLLGEVAGGVRLQSRGGCGQWVKQLLDKDKPRRLSVPALETLAIIAYRQPITRAEIENVRGVAVDHVVKLLMELHLIRIAGRSELPGRPFLYGTTRNFLDHFGLKDLKDLERLGPGILRSLEQERLRAEKAAAQESPAEEEAPEGEDEAPPQGETVAGDAEIADTATDADGEGEDEEEDEYDDEEEPAEDAT